jgi:hypothetical protein
MKRYNTAVKTIEKCLNEAKADQEIIRTHFDQFVHIWYELNLKEIQFKCQRPAVIQPVDRINFVRDTSLASLLINTSKDASSILAVAYLHTLSKMQNEIIGYFNNMILNDKVYTPHISLYERNAMTKNRQKVEGEVIVLLYSANIFYIKSYVS